MYGLILEGIHAFVTTKYSEETWLEIIRVSEAEIASFSTHDVYSDRLVPRIAEAASKILNVPTEQIMEGAGEFFIEFVGRYGYDNVLKVLGRDLRDFLNGLDNLHQYLRFTYPKLKSPSFFCVNESRTGLTLQYCSKRRGLQHYIRGQIREISRRFYQMDLNIQIVSMTESEQLTSVIYRLNFDNKEFIKMHRDAAEEELPVPSELFFEVFPFNIVFNRGMKMINIGTGLQNVMPETEEKTISDIFCLIRPLIEFTWEGVIMHSNNVFEMISLYEVGKSDQFFSGAAKKKRASSSQANGNCLKLKGQMMYIVDWDAIIFLGTPVLPDINSMLKTGLYINDLSMHDSSRDLVLAGSQQSAELKMALDREQQKSKKLEDIMRQLDAEIRRTDELLYQMIPKSVAFRLRRGVSAIDTCRTFEDVTILFSDVVGFTTICSHLQPLQVVTMLNNMYTIFDQLTEKNRVYKVETIGDAYMIVAGAPIQTRFAAIYIAEMAFDMLAAMCRIKDPADADNCLRIRVGIHTGLDTVQVSNKMEQTSEPQKIQISQSTRNKLAALPYVMTPKGQVEIKGKGPINTYWLNGRNVNAPQFEELLIEMNDEWVALMADEADQYTENDHTSAISGSAMSHNESEQHSRSQSSAMSSVVVNGKKPFGFRSTSPDEKKMNLSSSHLNVPEKAAISKETHKTEKATMHDGKGGSNAKNDAVIKQPSTLRSFQPLSFATVHGQSPTSKKSPLLDDTGERKSAMAKTSNENGRDYHRTLSQKTSQVSNLSPIPSIDASKTPDLHVHTTATASLSERVNKHESQTDASEKTKMTNLVIAMKPGSRMNPIESHVTNEKAATPASIVKSQNNAKPDVDESVVTAELNPLCLGMKVRGSKLCSII